MDKIKRRSASLHTALFCQLISHYAVKEKSLKVVQSIEELAKFTRNSSKSLPIIVSIDGFMGSGKSSLAMELADALDGMRVSFDCYIDPGSNSPSYLEKLKIDHLERDIANLKAKFDYVVIEGICLLQVLNAISVAPDIRIYVKRISEQGLWHDGFHLEDYVDERAIKEKEEGLHKSEFEYHAELLPHKNTDLIFERIENNSL